MKNKLETPSARVYGIDRPKNISSRNRWKRYDSRSVVHDRIYNQSCSKAVYSRSSVAQITEKHAKEKE